MFSLYLPYRQCLGIIDSFNMCYTLNIFVVFRQFLTFLPHFVDGFDISHCKRQKLHFLAFSTLAHIGSLNTFFICLCIKQDLSVGTILPSPKNSIILKKLYECKAYIFLEPNVTSLSNIRIAGIPYRWLLINTFCTAYTSVHREGHNRKTWEILISAIAPQLAFPKGAHSLNTGVLRQDKKGISS